MFKDSNNTTLTQYPVFQTYAFRNENVSMTETQKNNDEKLGGIEKKLLQNGGGQLPNYKCGTKVLV